MSSSWKSIHWKHVRAEADRIVREARARGITQAEIAAAGRLSRQSYLPKLLRLGDASKGPKIMNMLGVIEGCGIKVSDFFVAVERRALGDESPPMPSLRPVSAAEAQRDREISRRLQELVRLASSNPWHPKRPPKKIR